MGLIEKLQEILTIKNNIKTSIENKNVNVGNASFSEYPELIESIETDGGSGGDELALDTAEFLFFQGARLSSLDKLLKCVVDGTCRYYRAFYQSNKSISLPTPCEFKYKNFNSSYSQNDFYGSNYNFVDMEECFYAAKGLTNITIEDRGIPFNFYLSFYNCTALTEVNSTTETLRVGYGERTFTSCSVLTKIPKLILNGNASLQQTFRGCKKLKKVELEGRTSKTSFGSTSPTSLQLYYTFYDCSVLQSITGLDITNFTIATSPFYNCKALTTLDFSGTENVQVNLDLSSTGLTRAGLLAMLDTLPDISTGTARTLTIGDTKMALLTEADIALFTSKGYTLA